MNKDEVLKKLFADLNAAQSYLLIDSSAGKDVNDFNDAAYRVLEVAKLALRGQYHTVSESL